MSYRAMRDVCGCGCALAAAVVLFSASVEAGFVVDGDLSDWGVTNSTLTTWTIASVSSGAAIGDGFEFKYMREDSSDTAGDSGFLGPNYGGQNYDAEFLGVGRNGSYLVIAIVTGQRPDNGFARFAPGDIRIGTSLGYFGVEVGGGAGGNGGAAINEGAPGSTYTLNSSGFTTAHTASPPGNLHTAGSVWLTSPSDWILDPITAGTPPFDGKQPVQLQFTGGILKGTADYIYTLNSLTAQHAVIELAIPMSVFGGALIESVQWAPACGNDVLYVETAIHSPEPATLVMSLLGMAGFAGVRRYRRNAA